MDRDPSSVRSHARLSNPSQRNKRSMSIAFSDNTDLSDQIDLSMPEELGDLPFCPPFTNIRFFIHQLLSDPTVSRVSLVISIFITLLIIASCVTFILESMPAFKFPKVGTEEDDTLPLLVTIEIFAIVAFTIEYGLRLITAHACGYKQLGYNPEVYDDYVTKLPIGFLKTWLFIRQPFNIIDLVAILPFYVSIISTQSDDLAQFAFLRILRLARVFRIFKLGKYTEGAVLYGEVFKKSAQALYLLLFFGLIISVVMGSFIYFAEKGNYVVDGCSSADGGKRSCFMRDDIVGEELVESPFYSIPQAIWWVFTNITTVVYGDTYPTSFMGKVIAVITMHAGILGLALPMAIIGTNFREIFDMRNVQKFNERLQTRLSSTHTEELMDEMKQALETILTQVDGLQTTMRLYERAVQEKQKIIERQARAKGVADKYKKDNNPKEKYHQKQIKEEEEEEKMNGIVSASVDDADFDDESMIGIRPPDYK